MEMERSFTCNNCEKREPGRAGRDCFYCNAVHYCDNCLEDYENGNIILNIFMTDVVTEFVCDSGCKIHNLPPNNLALDESIRFLKII